MGRKAPWPPVVRPRNGVDVIRIRWAGRQRLYTLGPSGSEEARREYVRVLAELEATRGAAAARASSCTVGEVALAFLDRCKADTDPRQYARVRSALRPLTELYGHTAATDFGPLALETVRSRYVASGRYCRDVCNSMTSVVRQAFRWAASREMVGVEVHTRLATLAPLVEGRTTAVDHPPVAPVADADVEATLPELPPAVADMVRVQLLIGARPGELCLLRGSDITRPWRTFGGVGVWLFTLAKHKTRWKGGARAIAIGPKAQAVLLPYLEGRPPEAYLFSPAEVTARWLAERGRSARRGAKRLPGARYSTGSYAQCIESAAARAGVPHWTPNRLRHNAGTRIEADHGREAAQSVLGHATPSTTAIYAEITERAGRIAAVDG